MTEILQATSPEHIQAAKQLFTTYAESLGIDLDFQGFPAELATLPGLYAPPLGALLLAMEHGNALGCVALRLLEPPHVAEIKRLYVSPPGRGKGLGLSLVLSVLDVARAAGFKCVRLDTLPSMEAAQRMYERLGFRNIGAYRYNPFESARYMELDL